MFSKMRLKLISTLLSERDLSTILISLGITEEEYTTRYNNPKHAGFKSKILKNTLKEIDALQKEFKWMLGIRT